MLYWTEGFGLETGEVIMQRIFDEQMTKVQPDPFGFLEWLDVEDK